MKVLRQQTYGTCTGDRNGTNKGGQNLYSMIPKHKTALKKILLILYMHTPA